MALNIKNDRTVELVRQLAAMSGLSYTGAIDEAVGAMLEKRTLGSRDAAVDRALTIASTYRAHLADGVEPVELYDERGLYR